MRTTIRMDDGLLVEAKKWAVESGRTVTAVIEDAVREALARRRSAPPRQHIKLPTHGAGGLQPGVDLDNSAALLDLMDSEDAPGGR
jgi:hypothetical protein